MKRSCTLGKPVPKVSVITPFYQAQAFQARLAAAINAQTFTDFEWIIIDDGSAESAKAFFSNAIKRKDIALIYHRLPENAGVANARNVGLSLAQGEYVAFLDADDAWLPEKLARQYQTMQDNQWQLSYMDYQRVSEAGAALSVVHAPAQVDFAQLLRGNAIGMLTSMVCRNVAQQIKFQSRPHEDYIYWLDVLRFTSVKTAHKVAVNQPLANYTVRSDSLSSNKWRTIAWQWQIYRAYLKMPRLRALYYLSAYIFHALVKRI